MKIVEVIPGKLYAGGALDYNGWEFVKKNIHAVINVRTIQDVPPIPFIGRLFIWTPILDKYPPPLQWVISETNLMNVLMDTGNIVYVHDTAGINRLGFILTAYFMQRFHFTLDKALSIVRQKKPDIQPNPQYMDLLAMYENYLRTYISLKGDGFDTRRGGNKRQRSKVFGD